MSHVILDACCGGRMCWFNKNHPDALYVDIRTAEKGHVKSRPNHNVSPDHIVDFRSMPFPDKSFKLVLFDPPHFAKKIGSTGKFAKQYGQLDKENWREDLALGFSECWRVLDIYGTLVFKWSSSEIPLKEVLSCFSQKPLFGQTTNSKNTTHWMTFFKSEG